MFYACSPGFDRASAQTKRIVYNEVTRAWIEGKRRDCLKQQRSSSFFSFLAGGAQAQGAEMPACDALREYKAVYAHEYHKYA